MQNKTYVFSFSPASSFVSLPFVLSFFRFSVSPFSLPLTVLHYIPSTPPPYTYHLGDPSLLAVCKNSAPRSDPRRGCIKLYCRNCLEKYYCQAHPAIDPLPCPYCRGCCSCSRCRRDQEQERLETLEKNGNLADISPRSAVFRACRAKKSNKKKKRPFGGKIARFRLLDPPSTQTSTVSGNTSSPFDDISSNCGDVILENGIHSSPRICLNKFPVLQHGDNSAFHAPRFPFGAAPPPLHPIFLATQQERASHAQSTRLLSPNSLMSSLSSTPILPGAQLPPKSSVGNGGNTLLAHPTGLNAPVMPPLLPPLLPNNGSGGGSGNFPPYLPQNNPHRSGNFPLFSSNQGGNCGNGLSLQSTNTSPHNLTASFELQSASKTASQSHSTPPLQTSSISISQIPSSSSSSGQNHTFYLGGGSLGGPYPNQLTALGSSQPILSTAATPVGGSSAGGFQFQMLTATPLSLSQSNRNGTPQTPFGRMSRLYQSPPPIQPNSQLGVDHQQLVNMLTTQPILPQPRL